MARKRLETLTEQMFYVLLSLRGGTARLRYHAGHHRGSPVAGSAWGQGPCTLCWSALRKDGLIRRTRTEDNRKIHSDAGGRTLQNEYERIKKQAADMEQVLQRREES